MPKDCWNSKYPSCTRKGWNCAGNYLTDSCEHKGNARNSFRLFLHTYCLFCLEKTSRSKNLSKGWRMVFNSCMTIPCHKSVCISCFVGGPSLSLLQLLWVTSVKCQIPWATSISPFYQFWCLPCCKSTVCWRKTCLLNLMICLIFQNVPSQGRVSLNICPSMEGFSQWEFP